MHRCSGRAHGMKPRQRAAALCSESMNGLVEEEDTAVKQNVAGKVRGWGGPVLDGEGVRKGFWEVVLPELSLCH